MKLKELLQLMHERGLNNTTQLCNNIAQLETLLAKEILKRNDFAPSFDDYSLPAHAEKVLLFGFEAFDLYAAYLQAQECLSRNETSGYTLYSTLYNQHFQRVAATHRKQNIPGVKTLKYWS